MGELTFYVFDNLRAGREGTPPGSNVYRYDSLDEAVSIFNRLPDTYATAIGCSIGRRQEIDLVQRVNGEPVKVTDFYRMDAFNSRADVHDAMKKLQEDLGIRYEMVDGILPRRPCLCYLTSEDRTYPEINGRVIAGSGIDEVHVQGEGWLPEKEFKKKYNKTSYEDPNMPVVTFVNVKYQEPETGRRGSVDTHPKGYIKMVENTKAYNLSQEAEKEAEAADRGPER